MNETSCIAYECRQCGKIVTASQVVPNEMLVQVDQMADMILRGEEEWDSARARGYAMRWWLYRGYEPGEHPSARDPIVRTRVPECRSFWRLVLDLLLGRRPHV